MDSTGETSVRRGAWRSTALMTSPIWLAVLLNALVRPWLAGTLQAEEVRSGASVRGSDRWWVADPAAAHDSPALAAFLRMSDGAIGMAALACCVAIAITMWLVGRRRTSRAGR